MNKKLKHETYKYRSNKAEKHMIDGLNKLIDKHNHIIDLDRSIKRQMNVLLGKSKVDLWFEKKFSTPRKVKLIQNKAIHVVNPKHFTEDVKNTILSYLKKWDSLQQNKI